MGLPASTPLLSSIHLCRSSGIASISANREASVDNAPSFSYFFCCFHKSKKPWERRQVSLMSRSNRMVNCP